jgi:hypothetical protein
MLSFKSKILKIGINPYVLPPIKVLNELFKEAQKDKGPIPIKGILNDKPFIQTLVKYSGKWRLYLNGPMREAAGIDVGDMADITIAFDPVPRTIEMHSKLASALVKNKKAMKIFDALVPSLQKEIIRYINHLKTEDSIDRNVKKAILFLLGKERFIGRDKP